MILITKDDFELYEKMLEEERETRKAISKIMITMIVMFALFIAIMFYIAICL